jgi:multicomponent Na+:H+ antiporter subunit D
MNILNFIFIKEHFFQIQTIVILFLPILLYFFSSIIKNDLLYKSLLMLFFILILLFICFIWLIYGIGNINPGTVLFNINNVLEFKLALKAIKISFLLISYFLSFLAIIYSISYSKLKKISFRELIKLILLCIFSVNLIILGENLFVIFIGYELLSIVTYFLVVFQNKDVNSKSIGRKYLVLLIVFSSIFFLLVLILSTKSFDNKLNLLNDKENYIIQIWVPNAENELDRQINELNSDNKIYEKCVSDFKNIEKCKNTNFYKKQKNFFLYSLIFLLIFFASIKAATFPFHFWLPKAMIAHLPVSAVLHAALVVNSGIIVIFIVIFSKIGLINLGLINYISKSNFDIFNIKYTIQIPKILSGIGIVSLSFFATRKSEIKRILAYSTASQLNYILLSICLIAKSIGINEKSSNIPIESYWGVYLLIFIQIISHSFAKINLFFCAGYFYEKYQIKYKNEYFNLFKKEKIITIIFSISFLSLIGLPFLPGFFSKWNLIDLLIQTKDSFSIICFCISYIFSLYYTIPIIYNIFFSRKINNLDKDIMISKNKQQNKSFLSMKFAIIVCFIFLLLLIIPMLPLKIIVLQNYIDISVD